jgi:ABC-type nitrate/sulfonate/bicarbonate transport system substrate-binding protein
VASCDSSARDDLDDKVASDSASWATCKSRALSQVQSPPCLSAQLPKFLLPEPTTSKGRTLKRLAVGVVCIGLAAMAACSSNSTKASSGSTSGEASNSSAASTPASAGGSAGTSAAPSAVASSSAPAQLTSVKVAFANYVPDVMPLITAQADGFMAKQGLNVSATKLSGAAAAQSLVSGQVAFDVGGVTDALSAAAAGADIRVIAMLDYYDAQLFVTAPNVKAVADIAGKTYAGTSAAGAATTCLKQVMDHFQITDYKIKLVDSVPNMIAAVSNGAASGYCANPPASTGLVNKGYHVLWNLTDSKIENGQVGVITSESEIKNHPDVVQKFVNALQQVIIDEHKPSQKTHYVAAWAKAIGGDYTTAEWGDAFDYYTQQVTGPDMVPTVQVLSDPKKYLIPNVPAASKLDLTQVIDPTFAQNAKASYGSW